LIDPSPFILIKLLINLKKMEDYQINIENQKAIDARQAYNSGLIDLRTKSRKIYDLNERKYTNYLKKIDADSLQKFRIINYNDYKLGTKVIYRNTERVILKSPTKANKLIKISKIDNYDSQGLPVDVKNVKVIRRILNKLEIKRNGLFPKKEFVVSNLPIEKQIEMINTIDNVKETKIIEKLGVKYIEVITNNLKATYEKDGAYNNNYNSDDDDDDDDDDNDNEYVEIPHIEKMIGSYKFLIPVDLIEPSEIKVERIEGPLIRSDRYGDRENGYYDVMINPFIESWSIRESTYDKEKLSNSKICFGDGLPLAKQLKRKREIYQFIELLIANLTSNSDEGYTHLTEWLRVLDRNETIFDAMEEIGNGK